MRAPGCLSALLLITVACGSSTPYYSAPIGPTLAEVLARSGSNFRATFVTSRSGSANGVLVWREDGAVRRWDLVYPTLYDPQIGDVFIENAPGASVASVGPSGRGCGWIRYDRDPERANLQCGPGAGSGFVGLLYFPTLIIEEHLSDSNGCSPVRNAQFYGAVCVDQVTGRPRSMAVIHWRDQTTYTLRSFEVSGSDSLTIPVEPPDGEDWSIERDVDIESLNLPRGAPLERP